MADSIYTQYQLLQDRCILRLRLVSLLSLYMQNKCLVMDLTNSIASIQQEVSAVRKHMRQVQSACNPLR